MPESENMSSFVHGVTANNNSNAYAKTNLSSSVISGDAARKPYGIGGSK